MQRGSAASVALTASLRCTENINGKCAIYRLFPSVQGFTLMEVKVHKKQEKTNKYISNMIMLMERPILMRITLYGLTVNTFSII